MRFQQFYVIVCGSATMLCGIPAVRLQSLACPYLYRVLLQHMLSVRMDACRRGSGINACSLALPLWQLAHWCPPHAFAHNPPHNPTLLCGIQSSAVDMHTFHFCGGQVPHPTG